MSDISLYQEVESMRRQLNNALSTNVMRGNAFVEAEAAYYSAKARAAFRMKEEGLPASFIGIVIKGDPEVCPAMTAYHKAEVEYRNSQEAINVFKHNFSWLKDQYAREWSNQ